ncbi:MAG: peptidase S24 [Desulfobacterales bacterium]|nr:MAG: peptidase S24 [Desulfobacterales bacterium]
MLNIYRVRGDSMIPTLKDGDYVVAARLPGARKGRLVVVDHPACGIIVKRVLRRSREGILLESDNVLGTTTREMGLVAPGRILGTVLFAVRRPGR